jgi:hypothetical protein
MTQLTHKNDQRVADLFNKYAGEKVTVQPAVDTRTGHPIRGQVEPTPNDPRMEALTQDAATYGFAIKLPVFGARTMVGNPDKTLEVSFYTDHNEDTRIQKLELTEYPTFPPTPANP